MKKVLFIIFGLVVAGLFLGTDAQAQQATSQLYCEEAPAGTPVCNVPGTNWANRRKQLGVDEVCCVPKEQGRGGKGGAKSGGEPGVCEKLIWPQIVHRPRCSDFGPSQCKPYDPIKHCEDFYGQEIHGKIPACCWVGMQPNEVGGRGGKGGSTTPKGNIKNTAKVTAPVRGTKGSATIVKPSKTIERPVVLSKEVK